MKKIYLILFLLTPFFIFSQSSKTSKHQKAKHFLPTKALNTTEFVQSYYEDLGLNEPTDLSQKLSLETKNNWTRTRFTQRYKGLEVIGGSYVLHSKNNQVKKSTGILFPGIDINMESSKSKEGIYKALEVQLINNKKLEAGQLNKFLKSLQMESAELCVIDLAYPNFSGNYTLAYKVVSNNSYPQYDRSKHILHAHTGKLLFSDSYVCAISVEGIANTRYYGEQTITTDSLSPNKFILYDATRKVRTLNAQESFIWNIEDAFEFEDEDNYWDNANEQMDDIAGDLHYCTSAYHDFMLDNFGWAGVDGLGGELISVAHVRDRFYLNAFWNGEFTNYGNGRCVDYGPLTSLDVVGHEFAHGFTDFTSDLIYQNESGALNESISDIIGKALEYAYTPNDFNWYIGDKFTDSDVRKFRNMADPNEYSHPKHYKGQYWVTDLNFDRGGVHINSGLYNYWFYMLVEGKSDVNEDGLSFNVQPIGWEDALDIVFGVQLAYFDQNTTYFEAYLHTLEYAKDAFGEQSQQYNSVLEAWRAVGIDPQTNNQNIEGSLLGQNVNSIIFCGDDCNDLGIEIVNYSLEPMLENQEIRFSYEVEGIVLSEETYAITQQINPNDTLFYTFTRPICEADLGTNNTVDINVNYALDPSEDYEELFQARIEKSSAQGKDLEIVSLSVETVGCDASSIDISGLLTNNGCEVIEGDQSIDFIITINEDQQSLDNFYLFSDLLPGEFTFVSSLIFLNSTPNIENTYDFDLVVPSDVDPTNNIISDVFLAHEIMAADVEEFTNYEDQNSRWISVNPNWSNFLGEGQINGDSKLVIGGNNSFSNQRPCPIAEDIFLDANGETTIEFCFTTLGMTDPVLRFENTSYYSESVEEINPLFTSMNKVTIFENTFFETFENNASYGLSQGQETTITYDLPITESGDVLIEIICLEGSEAAILTGDYSQGDYQIFDNIRIEERGTVSVADELFQSGISVYPNPSYGKVTFTTNSQEPYSLEIFTINGVQVFKQSNIQSDFTWDRNNEYSGLLFYQIESKDGKTAQGKIIVN